MKFDPGYYKVKKRSGMFDASYHYMRVYIRKGVKFVQVDNGIPTEAEKCEEDVIRDYEVVKRITRSNPIKVRNITMTISWIDEDNDRFQLTARSQPVLEGIYTLFPRIAQAFGIRRNTEHNTLQQ